MIDMLLIVGADDATAERVAATIGYRTVALSAATVTPSGVSLLRGLDAAQLPSVIAFSDQIPVERSLQMAVEVHAVRPDADMVLVGTPDAQIVLEAMRAGIRDVAPSLDDATCLANLRSRLDARSGSLRVGSMPPPPGPIEFRSRTMTVFSPKGGVGKTTLSVNLAVSLAEMSPMEVVLVDLDLQFGDVSTVLDLHPTHTLEDAFAAGSVDSLLLKTYLTVHSAGFYVLCGAESPAANDKVTGEQVSELIEQLQTQFRYVLIDTAAGLDEATLAALEVSHDAIVLSSMDMACLRSVRKAGELIAELDLMPPSRHTVVNLTDKQAGLRIKDVEAVLGTPVDFVLPRMKEVQAAANRGVPVMGEIKGSSFAKTMRALAKRIYDRARNDEPKRTHRRNEVA